MALSSSGCTHLGASDNQKRWLVVGIALNKVVVPQIRPFVEQEVDKEYNNLKTSHNIHSQSTSGRLQRWPPRKFLKYENINGNSRHPKLRGGKYNISLFDCRVLSHIDFAKLYVENFMAKFNAFDDHCDASAVLTLLGGVPVFSTAVQAAAGDVRNVRNDWAHCVFSKWDPVKFQQSFVVMEQLVRVMALPAADEAKLLGELKDWETKGTLLCLNSPIDPVLLQLVQQGIKFLQDDMNNLSAEFDQDKIKVQQELQNAAAEMKQMAERLNHFQEDADQRIGSLEIRTGQVEEQVYSLKEHADQRFEQVEDQMYSLKEDADQRFGSLETRAGQVEDQVHNLGEDTVQRFGNLETRTGQVEDQVHSLEAKFHDLTRESAVSNASLQDPLMTSDVIPEKLVELIRRDYKGAVLCPFPWCEDELQLKLSNIFTRLQIVSRRKERSKLTHSIVNMTEIFKSHPECPNPRVVLIEGNPGMGKTTYCQKLAYDWSVEEIPSDASFPEVKILLLLKCRDMHMKTANIEEAIDDQLLPHDMGKKEKEDFFHFIHSNQSRILLALDGFDELREDLVQGFLPLIQGKVFANVYLMLTARHEAGMRVRRYCDTLLEIVGYTRDDVERYIKKYFSSREDQSLADKMIEILDSDKHLRELTVNPLNTALLCLLCEEKRGVFPSKKTMMYDDLVSCALRGYFAKKGISLGDEDPVERCASELNQLGEMAFEALLKTQLHFSEGEVKSQHQVDFLRLPFLSREPSVSKIKPKPCYAFTHKTFQEYFAAFYLAHQLLSGYKEKENLLDELSPIDNWQVWEFLILMVSSKSVEVAEAVVSQLCAFDYKKSFHSLIDDNVDFGVQIFDKENHNWVTEIAKWSRDENSVSDVLRKTLDLIAECEDGDSKLKDYQRKMVHVLARRFPLKKLELAVSARNCYVCSEYLKFCYTLTDLTLNNASALGRFTRRFNVLRLNETKPGNQSIETLLKRVFQPRSISTHLSIGGILISMAGCQIIATFLQTNRSLTHLNVGATEICDRGATALGNALGSACTLTHLNLRENMITAVGAAAIATSLQSNSGLIYLDLSWNEGGDLGAVALAQALESNRALKYLVLEKNGIGLKGGAALARALRFNRTLTYLDLTENTIGDSGAEAFGEVLRTNIPLTQLNLQCNEIESEGAKALGKALQSNTTLTHLSLRLNNYAGASYTGPLTIRQALRLSGNRLTRLDLSFTGFLCFPIAGALHTNSSLTHLRFCSNRILCDGASRFAKALKLNRTLTHLDLRQNDIRNSGAEELAYALKNDNNTLVYLDLRNNFGIMSEGRESLEQIDQSKCIVKY